jgi:POT family proton-dependent oligopeptide transporter
MIMYQAAMSGGNAGQVSPWWLIGGYAVITLGELMLSPMGLSLVSKVAPIRMRGLMMGGWFAATATGNYLVGTIGVKWTEWTHSKFFFVVAVMCAAVGLILFLIIKPLKKAMPGV